MPPAIADQEGACVPARGRYHLYTLERFPALRRRQLLGAKREHDTCCFGEMEREWDDVGMEVCI